MTSYTKLDNYQNAQNLEVNAINESENDDDIDNLSQAD